MRELASRPWPQASAVRVLYVEPTPMLGAVTRGQPAATMGTTAWPTDAPDVERQMMERDRQRAAGFTDWLREQGLHAEFRVRQGDARSGILDEAKEWHADLIVMGSHGYTGIKRWLLGSVAQAVVEHAPCSVEIVRAPVA